MTTPPTYPPCKIPLMNIEWRLSSSSSNSTPPLLTIISQQPQSMATPWRVLMDRKVGVIKLNLAICFLYLIWRYKRVLKAWTYHFDYTSITSYNKCVLPVHLQSRRGRQKIHVKFLPLRLALSVDAKMVSKGGEIWGILGNLAPKFLPWVCRGDGNSNFSFRYQEKEERAREESVMFRASSTPFSSSR